MTGVWRGLFARLLVITMHHIGYTVVLLPSTVGTGRDEQIKVGGERTKAVVHHTGSNVRSQHHFLKWDENELWRPLWRHIQRVWTLPSDNGEHTYITQAH